jgi:hypothetical protein
MAAAQWYELHRFCGCDTEQNHRLSIGKLRNQRKLNTRVSNLAPKRGNKKVALLIQTIDPTLAHPQRSCTLARLPKRSSTPEATETSLPPPRLRFP